MSPSNAEAIHIRGRSADDIGQLKFYENDGTTGLARLDSRTTHFEVGSYNELRFSAGGVGNSHAVIDTSGNFGIGADPSSYSSYRTIIKRDDSSAWPSPATGGSSGEAVLALINDNTSSFTYSNLVLRAGTGDCGIAAVYQNSANNSDLVFYTDAGSNGSEQMRLTHEGDVGIGTSSPSATLQITPPNEHQNSFRIYRGGSSGYQLNYLNMSLYQGNVISNAVSSDSSGKRFIWQVNGTEAARIEQDGSLNLLKTRNGFISSGSSDTGAVLKLHTEAQWESGYGNNPAALTNDYLGSIEFSTGDGSTGEGVRAAIRATVDSYYNQNSIVFETATGATAVSPIERMRVTDNGRVGIGIPNPTGSLHTAVKDSNGADVFVVAQNTTNNRIAGFKVLDESGNSSLQMQYDNGSNTATIINPNSGSLGIYLGGTGSANYLDDYETGTWTPVDGSGNAYNNGVNATYTKIGRIVYVNFDVSSTGSTTGPNIAGLPFTASPNSVTGNWSVYGGYSTSNADLWGHINQNSTAIGMFVGSSSHTLNGRWIGAGFYYTEQ